MSAVEKTSPGQFGWMENTSITRRAPTTPYEGQETTGVTRLRYVDKNSTAPMVGDPDEKLGASHGSISAHWSEVGPSEWEPSDIEHGFNTEEDGQMSLIHAGHRAAPSVEGMYSTRKGRVGTTRGLGLMANIVAQHTGQSLEASSNLSAHSAPIVAKLTGEPQEVSNGMDFWDEPVMTMLPGNDRPERNSTVRRGARNDFVSRMVPDTEVSQGNQRLKEHLQSVRPPKASKNEQLSLF